MIGQTVNVVTGLQTPAGRMIFAKVNDYETQAIVQMAGTGTASLFTDCDNIPKNAYEDKW